MDYCQLSTKIWTDEWFLELDSREKLFWIYLLTNDRLNVAGVYEFSAKLASFTTGLAMEDIQQFVLKFQEDHKICLSGKFIAVLKYPVYRDYDKPGNRNIRKAMDSCIQKLPESVKKDLINAGYLYTFDAPSEETKTAGDSNQDPSKPLNTPLQDPSKPLNTPLQDPSKPLNTPLQDPNKTLGNKGQVTKDKGQVTKDKGQVTKDKGQVTKDKGQVTKDSLSCPSSPDNPTPSENPDDKADYDMIISNYNSICRSLPRCTVISDKRRNAIEACWKAYHERLFEGFRKAEDSDFLSGRSKSGSWCSIDWLMVVGNMAKVLDGNYANSSGSNRNHTDNSNWDGIQGGEIKL